MTETVTVAILAGGLSSRMGRDKSFVELAGKPLIAHVIQRIHRLAVPTIIITNQPEPYEIFGLPVFTDILPDRSSLGGLYAAIYHSSTDFTLCIACDMPFLNPDLLKFIMTYSSNYDIVMPITDGHPQGLHALYRNTCLTPILHQLEQNKFKIRDLCAQVNTGWIDESTLRQYDRDLSSFININTPEALKAAERTSCRPDNDC